MRKPLILTMFLTIISLMPFELRAQEPAMSMTRPRAVRQSGTENWSGIHSNEKWYLYTGWEYLFLINVDPDSEITPITSAISSNPQAATIEILSQDTVYNDFGTDYHCSLALVRSIGEGNVTFSVQNSGGLSAQSTSYTCQSVAFTSLSIKAESTTMVTAQTMQLDLSYPLRAILPVISWSSSDENVMIVSDNGFVTAVGVGSATITATADDDSGISATILLTVSAVEAESINITGNRELNLLEGETVQLTATVLPENTTDKSITWTSSNPDVATISETGLVTAVSGNSWGARSTITARTSNGIRASVNVSVRKITVEMNSYENIMKIGTSQQLSVSFSPDTVKTGIVWTSSDPEFLSVNSTGLVTALSYIERECKITATIENGESATAIIMIDPGTRVWDIWFEDNLKRLESNWGSSNLTLDRNDSDSINVMIHPWGSDVDEKRLTVSNSNEQVAAIRDIIYNPDSASARAYSFVIDAVASGSATITVSVANISGGSVSSSIYLYVPIPEYTVRFVDWNGTELLVQTVQEGQAANPGIQPSRLDYVFTGWDKPFDNVTSDMTITAQYTLSADAKNRTHAVVHLTEAGTLKDYLTYETDFDRVDSLTVSGKFNGYDLAYIRSMEGLLKKLIYLDLRDIEIVNSDAIYYSYAYQFGGLHEPRSWCLIVLSDSIWEEHVYPNKNAPYGPNIICYRNNFDYAFRGMSQLREIRLPRFLTEIGPDICFGCSSLEKVVLPDAPVSIGATAFSGTALTEIILPETVESIGDQAFAKVYDFFGDNSMDASKSLKRVIAKNVTTVGNGAFSGCSSLEYVDLGKNVISYGTGCFEGCAIKSFEITNSITEIPERMFYGCEALESISVPDGVGQIGISAFENCHNLKTVKMTNSVTALAFHAFYDCRSLEYMRLSPNVREIGSDVFYNNPWLNSMQAEDHIIYINSIAYQADKESIFNTGVKSITIKEGTVVLADDLLNGCGLNSVTLPQSLLTLGAGSLAYNNFSTIELPENLEIIGLHALADCRELTSLTIPETVRLIGSTAFSGCDGLVRFTYNAVNADILASDDYDYSHPKILDYELVPGADSDDVTYVTRIVNNIVPPNVVRVSIGDNVKKIPNCLFNNCTNLGRFEMGQSVEEIGYLAFQNCRALNSIDLSNVKKIGESAFNGSSLKTVDLSNAEIVGEGAFNGVTTLESVKLAGQVKADAFKGCSALSELEILPTVKNIGNYAFADCWYLGQVDLSQVESFGSFAFLNCLYLNTPSLAGAVKIGDNSFMGCSSLTAGDLKNAKSVGGDAFEGCALVNVDLSGADSIGYAAFRNNSQLVSVKLNGAIGGYAFEGCKKLSDVEFGTGVRSIGEKAFSGCTSLPVYDNIRYAGIYAVEAADKYSTAYTIQDGTRWIGDEAFKGCESVVSISLPESLEYIGKSAFYGCKTLATIDIPQKVSRIGGSAFERCESLESVIIPNGVTVIESGTFYNCSNLKSVTIPGSVKNIMSNAFRGCSLQHVYCHAIEAPHADWTDIFIIIVFDNIANTTLHIPEGSENSYLYQSPWNEFGYYAYLANDDSEEPEPQTGITVRLYPVSEFMNETVYLYAWTGNGETMPCGAWPGIRVSKDAQGWWSYTFDESIKNINIIWNSGDGYQTVDITGVTSSTCYRLSDESSYPFKVEVIDCDTPIDVGVESITSNEPSAAARIVFINGSLYILHNGKIYTTHGQEVK